MEVTVTDAGYGRGWSGCFTILITNIFVRRYYLQYTSFLCLSNKESGIVSAVFYIHASGKQRDQISVIPHKTPSLFGLLTQGNI